MYYCNVLFILKLSSVFVLLFSCATYILVLVAWKLQTKDLLLTPKIAFDSVFV
jgi:hypothetical protein